MIHITSGLSSPSLRMLTHSSLGVYLCHALSWINCFLFPIACAVPLIINRVPIFTVFASLKHSCFQRVARARATLLLACSPWWFRTLGFHPGYIPGQGTKISLQDCSLLSLQDQHYFPNHKRWPNTLIAPSPEIS